jgi:DNA-binding protein H-NS
MPKLDLDAMDFEELWTLHEQLIQILSEKITAEKRELERRLERLTGAELNRAPEVNATKRKYPKVLPKYCNPLVPTERWSGRGKKPRWLVAALKAGRTLEEFKIDDFEKLAMNNSSGRSF